MGLTSMDLLNMDKDLVCGMIVDKKKVTHKSEYEGKTYYFCSEFCKRAFDKEPRKYVIV